MTEFLAELIGTALLILLGAGVVAGVALKKSKANGSGWIVITMGWGLAVTFAAYLVGPISGAHLNPALTIGLAIADKFSWNDVPMYVLGQMIGAIIGAAIVGIMYWDHFKATEDSDTVLGVFSTGPAIPNYPLNVLSEIVGTFVLVLLILVMDVTVGMGPFVTGFLIVSIGLSLGGPTGYAINPARDLGPRIAHFLLPLPNKGDSNWKYAWVPVVGPIIGGVLAALLYIAFFK
jgi:glycerol uptake facilitator protein